MAGFKPINDLFMATMSNDVDRTIILIRARTKHAAYVKARKWFKETGYDVQEFVEDDVYQHRLPRDVTCIVGA